MKTFLPPVAAAMAIFLVAAAITLWRQDQVVSDLHHRLGMEHAAAQDRYDELFRTRLAQARELQAAHDQIAQLGRELEVARAAAGLTPDRDHAAIDPAMDEFRLRQQRRIVQERYGDLFNELQLSATSLEEFKRLLIELEEPDTSRRAPGGSGDTPRRTFAEIHDGIYYLLGYEDYTTFDRFGRELTSTRPLVRRFANDADDAGHPLTAIQRTALSRVIFETTDPQLSTEAAKPSANVPDPSTGLTSLDRLVLQRASDVLSQPQLDLLQKFRIQERDSLTAWRRSLAPEATAPAVP